MTYDVLKDYEDVAEYPIPDSKETRKVTVLSLKVGQKFIPAEMHYPQNKVDALVTNGTLKLVEKPKPVADVQSHDGPEITSAPSATFAVGRGNTFDVTATGTPAPKITAPLFAVPGLSFSDGVISGTPVSADIYSFTITASNGAGPDVTQAFTLTVV